jgi:hypothetical protein
MLAAHLLRVPGAAKLAGYVCGITLFQQSMQPWLYAVDRFVETVLGTAVAIGVSMLPKLLRDSTAHSPGRAEGV